MNIIPPKSGASLVLKSGQRLKVTDIEGMQVSDILFYNRDDVAEKLSSGKTFDYEETILLTKGNYLWSNRSNKMVRIVEDINGRNDFLLAPCDMKTFEHFYNMDGYHPSCFENLYKNLQQFGIEKDDIPSAFNIFMNVQFKPDGKVSVVPPTSKAKDYIIFEAQMDLIVALTACSAKDSNGGTFKPIGYEILD
ncbi:urea carboxylase-associated family protein [Mesonia ostreae]|uniref:Urea carboxylase-associated family protein n=1 Tax=Mesonia ostreae TaxID=861110 RepID=A0ABU2KE96_9FLAO|nr:urea carboxylase-associated family protein [Mesonia ostreae]MDT0293023.1 urea carboxylase-associated family protein [Mesonia ostreae]